MAVGPRSKVRADETVVPQPVAAPLTNMAELNHLLKVAGSVSQDANEVWTEMWGEFRRLVTGNGAVIPEAAEQFVPACGWPEFLEKFWLLKHYLGSIQRICDRQQ